MHHGTVFSFYIIRIRKVCKTHMIKVWKHPICKNLFQIAIFKWPKSRNDKIFISILAHKDLKFHQTTNFICSHFIVPKYPPLKWYRCFKSQERYRTRALYSKNIFWTLRLSNIFWTLILSHKKLIKISFSMIS